MKNTCKKCVLACWIACAVLAMSGFGSAPVAAQGVTASGIEGCMFIPRSRGGCGAEPATRPSPSQSTSSPSGSNSGQNTQQIINALGAFNASMERIYARERAERAQREAEEAQWQAEKARRQAEERQQSQAALEAARNDPSLNPFGAKPSASPTASATPPAPDPSQDLSGQACRWLVVRDEESCNSRLCFYRDGDTIAYGPFAYRCEAGRWAKMRDCNQSPTEQHKKECLQDLPRVFGVPEKKEIPGQKIFSQN